MAGSRSILAAAVCCTIVSAALAAQDALLTSQALSSVPGVTNLPTPFQLQDPVQHQEQHEQPLQAVDRKAVGTLYSSKLVTHRLHEDAKHPTPLKLQEAQFPAAHEQQHESEDVHRRLDLDVDLVYPAKSDLEVKSTIHRKLSQDDASSTEQSTDPEEPVCAHYSKEVNNYIDQGWRVKFTQFATPEKCPESCKTDYRGPATGIYNMQCNAAKCFCTFSTAGWHYKNVVMKDSGALSIVGAMPAGCPKGDCVGGGFEFCQPDSDC